MKKKPSHITAAGRLAVSGRKVCTVETLENRCLLSGLDPVTGATVVHWWGDYVRTDPNNPARTDYGNRRLRSHLGVRVENLDLDGDQDFTDDQILHWAFSMTDPLNPRGPEGNIAEWGYYSDRPSARFYGGMVIRMANFKPSGVDQASIEGDEGANLHLPLDARYPHSIPRGQPGAVPEDKYSDIAIFPYDGAAPFPVHATEGPDDRVDFHAAFLWKKEDFLGGGNAASAVQFDETSLLSVDVTRHWKNLTARWVVQDGSQFYVSEATIDRLVNGVDNPFGKVNSVVPTATRWALWDPTAQTDPTAEGYLDFDQAGATWEQHQFTDVQSIGMHFEQDVAGYYPDGVRFVFDNVQANATLVPGPVGAVEFDASTYAADESTGAATILVRRTGGAWGDVTVDYATADGTAIAGVDYTATSGTLSFLSGESAKTITISVVDDSVLERGETVFLTLSNPTGGAVLGSKSSTTISIRDANETGIIVAGDMGGSTVRVFGLSDQKARLLLRPFGTKFKGGVRVAAGDVNGDGVPDAILAPGPGIAAVVKAYDGLNGKLLFSIVPFGKTYSGGVNVAAGDVNGDGRAEIIVGSGGGMIGQAKVFSGRKLQFTLQPYGRKFKGSVVVASGRANTDGLADIVTVPGPGAAALIRAFDGATRKLFGAIYAYDYDRSFGAGVSLAVGDANGDGVGEIYVAPLKLLSPRVRILYLADGRTSWISAYDQAFRNGLAVATVDLDADGDADAITAPGPGMAPMARLFTGSTQVGQFLAFSSKWRRGVNIAASR